MQADQEACARARRREVEESAIAVLRGLAFGEAGHEAKRISWSTDLGRRQRGGDPLTTIEHVALACVARAATGADCVCRARLDAILAASWRHLTGHAAEPADPAGRLPRSALRRASRQTRLFHMAAFQPRRAAAEPWRSAGRDCVPTFGDMAVVTAALAIGACSEIGRTVLASAAAGYAIASVFEYGMHRWAGHEAGGPLRPLLRRLGCCGRTLLDYLHATYVGHFVIHHVKTSNRNYTDQFAKTPPGDRATVDAELDAMGAVATYIRASDYGMTLSHSGVAAGVLATLPVHAALIWTLGLGWLAAATLAAPTLLYVAASKCLHPRLHKTRVEAMREAGPLMRLFLSTRYVEWVARTHWIHHKGGGGNFNLVPGADLMFGQYRKPNLRMVLRMRADGIMGASW